MPESDHTSKRADHKKRKSFSRSKSRAGCKPSSDNRARSIPYKKRFIVAVLFSLVFFISLIGLITSAVAFFYVSAELKKRTAELLIVCLAACIVTWFCAYIKRRSTICPLCKSTPFLDNLAHKHTKAYRIRPFNYGVTAILNTLFIQRWRCMYCGTSFDLLKVKKKST